MCPVVFMTRKYVWDSCHICSKQRKKLYTNISWYERLRVKMKKYFLKIDRTRTFCALQCVRNEERRRIFSIFALSRSYEKHTCAIGVRCTHRRADIYQPTLVSKICMKSIAYDGMCVYIYLCRAYVLHIIYKRIQSFVSGNEAFIVNVGIAYQSHISS